MRPTTPRAAAAAVGLAAALAALAALVAPARPAAAEPSRAHIAGVLGVRANLGALSDRYAYGWLLYGVEAGYHPNRSMLGLSWWLVFGRYSSSDERLNVEGTLGITQMGLGARLRVPLTSRAPAYFLGTVGAELVRTSIPVPPDDGRLYFGPTLATGLQLQGETLSLSATTQVGVLAGGPAGISFLIAIGVEQ